MAWTAMSTASFLPTRPTARAARRRPRGRARLEDAVSAARVSRTASLRALEYDGARGRVGEPVRLVARPRARVLAIRVDDCLTRPAPTRPPQPVDEQRSADALTTGVGMDGQPLHVAAATGGAGDRVAARSHWMSDDAEPHRGGGV